MIRREEYLQDVSPRLTIASVVYIDAPDGIVSGQIDFPPGFLTAFLGIERPVLVAFAVYGSGCVQSRVHVPEVQVLVGAQYTQPVFFER